MEEQKHIPWQRVYTLDAAFAEPWRDKVITGLEALEHDPFGQQLFQLLLERRAVDPRIKEPSITIRERKDADGVSPMSVDSGTIYVNTARIELYGLGNYFHGTETDDIRTAPNTIASTLAHETAHVVQKDMAKEMHEREGEIIIRAIRHLGEKVNTLMGPAYEADTDPLVRVVQHLDTARQFANTPKNMRKRVRAVNEAHATLEQLWAHSGETIPAEVQEAMHAIGALLRGGGLDYTQNIALQPIEGFDDSVLHLKFEHLRNIQEDFAMDMGNRYRQSATPGTPFRQSYHTHNFSFTLPEDAEIIAIRNTTWNGLYNHFRADIHHLQNAVWMLNHFPKQPPDDAYLAQHIEHIFDANGRVQWAHFYRQDGIDANELAHIKHLAETMGIRTWVVQEGERRDLMLEGFTPDGTPLNATIRDIDHSFPALK
jgi:hypothetical protein